jgi:hypothetical protein
MRGFAGFVWDVLFPGLFASLIGLGILANIRRAPRKRDLAAKRPWRAGGPGTVILVMIFLVLPLSLTYVHLRIHYDLWTLQPADVQEIKVGERSFIDRTSISQIVGALKSCEWYSVNHGGWGDETPMVVRLKSGAVWQMNVGYHFTHHGAVVLRSSEPRGRGWPLGQVFSLTLPETLERLGVPLSLCDTAHGHPCLPGSTADLQ